jgi:hypothetical protein
VRAGGHGDFVEHFRIGSDGQVADTQYDLVSREEAEERRDEQTQWTTNEQNFGWFGQQQGWGQPAPPPPPPSFFAPWGSNQAQPQPQPQARGLFAPWGNQGYQR